MAQRQPVPSPGGGTSPIWIVNLIDWIFQVLQETIGFLSGVRNIDQKLGVLVGNDAKLQVNPDIVPPWVANIVNRVFQVEYRPLNEGCLGFREIDTVTSETEWVGFHRMVNAYLHSIASSLTNEAITANTPFYSSFVDSEHPGLLGSQTVYKTMSQYSTEPASQEPIQLDAVSPKPNVLHILASIVALLSIAQRITIPLINPTQVAKLDDSASQPGTFNGSIADVVNAQDIQMVSPTDKVTRTGYPQT